MEDSQVKAASSENSASRATLHMVAKLHYESGMSQIEIARRLGFSAATVSRLLKRALDEGIVRIEIQDLGSHEDLGRELAKRLKLKLVALSDGAASSPLTGLSGWGDSQVSAQTAIDTGSRVGTGSAGGDPHGSTADSRCYNGPGDRRYATASTSFSDQ